MDLVEGSLLQNLMGEAFQHSLRNPDAKTMDILTGPWCRSYLAEEHLSVELGSLLIPEILREHLAGADFVDHPCSVVLAGNLSALLPVPLLGVSPLRRNGVYCATSGSSDPKGRAASGLG
jgi:hypothetical protein